jgi:putative tricarboxylic transport membrane protein
MTISNGDWSIFLTHPLSAFLLALAALGLLGPWLYSVWQNARARRAITGGEA